MKQMPAHHGVGSEFPRYSAYSDEIEDILAEFCEWVCGICKRRGRPGFTILRVSLKTLLVSALRDGVGLEGGLRWR